MAPGEPMEPLDAKILEALAEVAPDPGPARVLIVNGDTQQSATLTSALAAHQTRTARTIRSVRTAIARHQFDVVLLDPALPRDGSVEVMQAIQTESRFTRIIVTSADEGYGDVVSAVRDGASDFVMINDDAGEIAERVTIAAHNSREDRCREIRLRRLKKVCQELNTARHEIAEQIDVLCRQLASAYEGIEEQLSEVAMASEFRALVRQELDIEELLRTTLEYLLTKTGPTNAAVFLPDTCRNYGLGAYVNYDCPRESVSLLLDHIGSAICPQMEDEPQIIRFRDADTFSDWCGLNSDVLVDCDVLSFACRREDETMAVVVLFRNLDTPFDKSLLPELDTLREIFAEQLDHVIRVHHRAEPNWPNEAPVDSCDEYDEFGGGGFEPYDEFDDYGDDLDLAA